MPEVKVVARNSHRGHLERLPQRNRSVGRELRPVCDSCGWKGPRYADTDEPVARVGLDAHIATADSGWMYQITARGGTARGGTWVWDWDDLSWQ